MPREHNFNDQTKRESWVRQHGNCACCGKDLVQQAHKQGELPRAHHVVPNQSGDQSRKQDPWMSSSSNCVYVCDDCHHQVHEHGKYRNGAVAGPENFKYSHGSSQDPKATAEHNQWAQGINNRWDQKHDTYKARSK